MDSDSALEASLSEQELKLEKGSEESEILKSQLRPNFAVATRGRVRKLFSRFCTAGYRFNFPHFC
jgi:hypothetical protein